MYETAENTEKIILVAVATGRCSGCGKSYPKFRPH